MINKILATFASFALATALVIAPSIVDGGNSNIGKKAEAWTESGSFSVGKCKGKYNYTGSKISISSVSCTSGKVRPIIVYYSMNYGCGPTCKFPNPGDWISTGSTSKSRNTSTTTEAGWLIEYKK